MGINPHEAETRALIERMVDKRLAPLEEQLLLIRELLWCTQEALKAQIEMNDELIADLGEIDGQNE